MGLKTGLFIGISAGIAVSVLGGTYIIIQQRGTIQVRQENSQDDANPKESPSTSDAEVDDEAGQNNPSHILLFTAGGGATEPGFAKCDSGSTENWISSDMLDRLNIDVREFGGRSSQSFLTASGESIRPRGWAPVCWTCNARKTRRTDFLVADNLPVDVILGSKLLTREGITSIYTKESPVLVLQENKPKGKKEKKEEKARRKADHEANAAREFQNRDTTYTQDPVTGAYHANEGSGSSSSQREQTGQQNGNPR